MKTRFTRRWIILDEKTKSSVRNEFTRNVLNFGVNSSNSKHSENKIIYFMVLGKKLKRIVGIIGQAKILFDKKTPSVWKCVWFPITIRIILNNLIIHEIYKYLINLAYHHSKSEYSYRTVRSISG